MTAPRRSHSRLEAFRHAFSGWRYALRTQRNAWIHTIATVLTIGLGIWLRVDILEWVILLLTIGLVWLAELFNTALEVMIDMFSPDTHPLAGISKDVGAAAVLVAAIIAAAVGFLVLGPPLINRLSG